MSRGRIHRVLMEVEAGRGTARERLDALPAQPGEDPRDLVLAREVVYGTLRRLGTIDHLLGVRSWPKLVGIPLLLSGSGYTLFILLLNARFPWGPIENALSGLFF